MVAIQQIGLQLHLFSSLLAGGSLSCLLSDRKSSQETISRPGKSSLGIQSGNSALLRRDVVAHGGSPVFLCSATWSPGTSGINSHGNRVVPLHLCFGGARDSFCWLMS